MTLTPLLRNPWRFVRIVLVFLFGLAVAWFALTEIVYQVKVAEIAPKILPPPQGMLPPRVRQVAWVASGGAGSVRMRPAYLGWLPVEFLGSTFLKELPARLWFRSGMNVASRIQVNFYPQAGMDLEKRTMATVWITRHWTADQALIAMVGNGFYGCGIYDLEAASRTFLGKPADSLDLPQAVSMLAYWRSPERYRKDSVSLKRSFESLQDRVIENFPELASEKGPMPRFLVGACPTDSIKM